MNKEAIQKYLQEQNIEHHRTRAVMLQIFGLFFVVFFYCLLLSHLIFLKVVLYKITKALADVEEKP